VPGEVSEGPKFKSTVNVHGSSHMSLYTLNKIANNQRRHSFNFLLFIYSMIPPLGGDGLALLDLTSYWPQIVGATIIFRSKILFLAWNSVGVKNSFGACSEKASCHPLHTQYTHNTLSLLQHILREREI